MHFISPGGVTLLLVYGITWDNKPLIIARRRVSIGDLKNPCVGGSIPPWATTNLNSPLVGLSTKIILIMWIT